MFQVRVIDQDTVKRSLLMEEVIAAVEKGYEMKAQGKTELFPILTHDFEVGVSDFDIKSGHIGGMGIYGMKTVSYFSQNAEKGLPNLIGVLTIYDANTGIPLGILDATYITCMRTGAAGAIGVKYLARQDAKNVLIVGAGKQAVFQIAALLTVRPHLREIKIYDGLAPENAHKLADHIAAALKEDFSIDAAGVQFSGVKDIAAATADSDIIITATPSRAPQIFSDWVKKGTHFSCVGSDTQGKQEIDENIFKTAQVFVDDAVQCIRVGEIEKALQKGIMKETDILGEIGALITGELQGRRDEEAITVYDTTGIAIQDLVTAKIVLDKAAEKNLGTLISL